MQIKKLLNLITIFALAAPTRIFAADSTFLDQFNDPTSGPIQDPNDILIIINNIANVVLLAGAAAMIAMVVWGSITWMTSGGNEERITKGKKILTAAFIGLGIVLLSKFLVVSYIQLIGGKVN